MIDSAYSQIEKFNHKTKSLITVIPKHDRSNAKGPLAGIPFVLKDSYLTSGIKTTAGSRILSNYHPTYDATVYRKLVEAGAILVGKGNMDAWGHGATNENSDFGLALNPYDLSRVAGGSGGGVAAAIALGMAEFGIGEDTGGSIRNPAAWCGITALKVTYGRVSRYGCIAYASSFDTVGPTAKTAEECAVILEIIAGRDPLDATSSDHKVEAYSKLIDKPIKNMTIGWPEELFTQGLDPEILEATEKARKELEKLGVKFKKVSMPLLKYGISLYYVIAPSETSSNLARYDGIRFGEDRTHFGAEAKRRIMMGTYALSAGYYDAYYKKAQQVRTLLVNEYDRVLKVSDAIMMPVTPTTAPKLGELTDDPIKNMLSDVFTVTQNPVGVPSLALPCGFSKNGLPIGMQLIGDRFAESTLLRLGHQYQKVTEWHTRKPKI